MNNQLGSRINKLESAGTDEDATAQFFANLKALSDGTPAPYPNASNAPLAAALRLLEAEEMQNEA